MYKIEIFYSAEDEGYIAIAPDLPGCSAFGETEEAALEEIKTAQKLWLETAQEEDVAIPELEVLPAHLPKAERDKEIYKKARTIQAIRKGTQRLLPVGC
jgi:predicted RNase H-like HicB family nuclease